MTYDNRYGLKGQLILAQGKRSVALGWEMGLKIVRAIMFLEGLSFLRTKRLESQFRPQQVYCFNSHFFTDGFSISPITQGGVLVRSSRNYALG
jgi:hypothetical protein